MTTPTKKSDEKKDPIKQELARPSDPAVANIADLLDRFKPQIQALVGPHLTVENLFAVARLALGRVPKLKECTAASVLGCVMESSRLGLQPGAGPGETWLIPRQNRQTGKLECTLVVDYRGLIKLMQRDAGVHVVLAEAVCDGDTFLREIGREGMSFMWRPRDGERGHAIGYFAAAWDKDKNLLGCEYRSIAEIDRASRARSMARDNGPWKTDPEAMYRKSVIRQLAKLLPGRGNELQRAVATDERAELGLPQDLHLLADPTLKAQEDPAPLPETEAPKGPVNVEDLMGAQEA